MEERDGEGDRVWRGRQWVESEAGCGGGVKV